MVTKKLLAPSILSADFSNLSQQIRLVEIGGADLIHCDIMDGRFVPNLTFGPMVISSIRNITNLPIDAHLMVENPENLIDSFIEAGVNYLTVHQEAVVHLHRTVDYIKSKGVKAGVSINPATPIHFLNEILEFVDLVLIMSVNPGFGGQKFIHSSLRKIKELSKIREEMGYNFLIEVDGGLTKDNIKDVSNAGCNIFVVGWSIFGNDNKTAATTEFKNLINNNN
ncbi:MAG: ribulose-phosphate 3-epimerase [Melioribacter sp.]|uniref:ribulose-phosphate 3-epimerase n=1 Tax=Rosettibacter primus TaxID=3111523 RepID=UPI00247B3DFC|nr:ribulose-phosphate 3-epimerase [Melioribacter sp.]